MIKVEDGTGLDNSQSYISLAFANSYHSQANNNNWFVQNQANEQEQALVNASQAIDLKYGKYYLSYILKDEQSMLFPRVTFEDNQGREITGIPTCLKQAVAEMALLIFTNENVYELPTNTGIQSESVSVGPVSESKTYITEYSRNPTDSRFTKINKLMYPIMRSQNHGRIIRT